MRGLLKHCESLTGRGFQAKNGEIVYEKISFLPQTKPELDCMLRQSDFKMPFGDLHIQKTLFYQPLLEILLNIVISMNKK